MRYLYTWSLLKYHSPVNSSIYSHLLSVSSSVLSLIISYVNTQHSNINTFQTIENLTQNRIFHEANEIDGGETFKSHAKTINEDMALRLINWKREIPQE